MKIGASGTFGSFVWEVPADMAEQITGLAAEAQKLGEKVYGPDGTPDMTRHLTDEVTQQVTRFLLLLYGVSLLRGAPAVIVKIGFDEGMQELVKETRRTLRELKEIEREEEG